MSRSLARLLDNLMSTTSALMSLLIGGPLSSILGHRFLPQAFHIGLLSCANQAMVAFTLLQSTQGFLVEPRSLNWTLIMRARSTGSDMLNLKRLSSKSRGTKQFFMRTRSLDGPTSTCVVGILQETKDQNCLTIILCLIVFCTAYRREKF